VTVAGPDEDEEGGMIDKSIARIHHMLAEEEAAPERPGARPGREPDRAEILRMLQVVAAQLEQRRAAIAANSIILSMLPQTAQLDPVVAARLAANSIPAARGNETTRALAGKIAAAIVDSARLLRTR
jgi:hypothetical protein